MAKLTDEEILDTRRALDRILWAMFCPPMVGKNADGGPTYRDDQIKSACEIIDQLRGTSAKPTAD